MKFFGVIASRLCHLLLNRRQHSALCKSVSSIIKNFVLSDGKFIEAVFPSFSFDECRKQD